LKRGPDETRGFTPRKRLGQHFLRDPNIVRKIVAAVQPVPGAQVVEIGPGRGALTSELLARFPDLIAIEVDERAVDELREMHPSLNVRPSDVLSVDWAVIAAAERPVYVVGNLPYNITTPILFALLDGAPSVVEAVVMMQLEVARRLVARPRSKDYGILSVAVQLGAQPDLLFRVSRNVFEPKPAVESAVVRVAFDRGDRPRAVDEQFLRTVIRRAFNQRRKTLRNSLSSLVPDGVSLPERWSRARAEELSPPEFVELARFLMP